MNENLWHIEGTRGNWTVEEPSNRGWTFVRKSDAERLRNYLNAHHRAQRLLTVWNDALSDDVEKMSHELYELREENKHLI